MDKPEVKKRVAISYIVVAICMFGVFAFTTWYNNMRAEQRAAENPDSAVTDTTPVEDEVMEEEQPVELTADHCAANGYRYRIINDAEELAYYGLPAEVTEEIMGGTFATADSKITLYAYPAYGCRAYLIAGREDAYSFCILDGLTDTTLVPTLADLLPLYGIYGEDSIRTYGVTDAVSLTNEVVSLTNDELVNFLELTTGCTYAGDKMVAPHAFIEFTSARGALLSIEYDAEAGLLMAGGLCFNVSDEMAELLK